ncbi:hypothetical protein [Streptomyces sp.]|uniref:hypothetical protein n=1 Tax=Streptomyces sp. TaxID=1931 RepID=UPI002F9337C0
MTRSAHGTLVVATAVLLYALSGCGTDSGTPGTPGTGTGPERPCPSSATPGSPTPTESATGSPGDSQAHTPDPSRNCIIESGAPAMPEDP